MSDKPKGPTILRDLKIKSVSVVDQGANQHAHFRLTKRADDPDAAEEQGQENKAEEQVGNDTAFFARIGKAAAKMLHLSPKGDEDVEKEAQTFSDIDDTRETYQRIYRITDALGDSLRSIVSDSELSDEQKAALIVESADQSAQAIKDDIAGVFAGGAVVSKNADGEGGGEQPASNPAAEANPTDQNPAENPVTVDKNHQEGEETDMKFNVDAMTQEERAQFEDLQKRYCVNEQPSPTPAQPETHDEGDAGDIYKGLNPAVKAEIETLRKFREDAENREMMEVAKRYTIIGKKPEELAPVLKSLKAAGGTAYADMIAVLDSAVQTVEKSGVFGEIGKRGTGDVTDADDAWAKIEVAAQEIAKSNSGITFAQAIDKACVDHPDLLEAYEKSRK